MTIVIDGVEYVPISKPTAGTLTLSPEQVAKLITRTGGLPFRTAQDLVDRVDTLAGITFHHVFLDFSPQQLAELADQAERRNTTVEAHAISIVNKMREEFFMRASGDSIVGATPAERGETPAAKPPVGPKKAVA